jgi:flavin reductase (DIM6/NTAB) family NADH-FMN oxidoreductase RutF
LSVDPDSFRSALASVCTPVAVVTSRYGGRAHGTTVSAFCSLSLEPPLVVVSLDRSSELLAMVVRAGEYAMAIGLVRRADTHGDDPLLYRQRRFGTLAKAG